MTDLTKLREVLDKMIAGYSYDAFERNGNNYPPARAAVEALFAELARERDEARAALSELVRLKAIKETLKAIDERWPDYEENKPKAWARARELVVDAGWRKHEQDLELDQDAVRRLNATVEALAQASRVPLVAEHQRNLTVCALARMRGWDRDNEDVELHQAWVLVERAAVAALAATPQPPAQEGDK